MLYLCFQHLCSSLRKFVAYVTFSRCFSRGRGVSTPRSASHRRGPRDTLHLTRHNRARTRQTVAPGAVGSTKHADTRHRLHLTRQNPTKTNQTVAPSAAGAQNQPHHHTSYTPRDTTRLKHAKPSHQVQPVHKNQPHHHTNYTPRDTSKLKHAKPSHQVQSVYKNTGGPTPKGEPASSTRSTPVADR